MISERTKAALHAAKARGKRLGQPKGHKIPSDLATLCAWFGCQRGQRSGLRERLRPVLVELEGLSVSAAAKELDRRGYATARTGKWAARSVIDVRTRLGLL
jgi:hypothetical protein